MGPNPGGPTHPSREGASSAMAQHPVLRVQTRRLTIDGDTHRVQSPHASGTTSRTGIVRRVGSPAVAPMLLDSPLSSPIHAWSPSHVRAFSPTARAWSPSLRPQALGRAAAYAAQSLVDAVTRSLSPTSIAEGRMRPIHTDESVDMAAVSDSPGSAAPVRTNSASEPEGSGIVAPQARHGAVWLQMERSPKHNRRRRAPRKPRRVQIADMLNATIACMRLLVHPRDAVRVAASHIEAQCNYWDEAFRDPTTGQRAWRPPWLSAYIPLLIWLAVSVCSSATVLVFHNQVFQALDAMSRTLRELGVTGRIVLGLLIFLTTFPPMPLYSTLVVVSGFAFGMWQGFIVSYIAALAGAITVFVLSRSLMRMWMIRLLNQSGGLKRVVHAIEKRPQLLFLVRLAPYPYNLMNTLLASSSTLTLKTYVLCTALPLFKLMVHTALGASIQDFAAFNGADSEEAESASAESPQAARIHRIAGIVGLLLCIGVLIYIAIATQRAVDEIEDADHCESENEIVATKEFDFEEASVCASPKPDAAEFPLLPYAQDEPTELFVDPIAEMERAAETQHHRRVWT
ncbi:hypothetical protein MCUN1_001996 [Malassezia cuniculi]|uniref:Golgi apparatus membrane protein TVP38 n=1 Tax=Malassezia cuniculi TaxID=948313 RepID=A0AAF0EV07_9BASI|nr:hypothetical protein MCUN1_001996 [Malassezia cuniculi]